MRDGGQPGTVESLLPCTAGPPVVGPDRHGRTSTGASEKAREGARVVGQLFSEVKKSSKVALGYSSFRIDQ
jgi:hypothetical protein